LIKIRREGVTRGGKVHKKQNDGYIEKNPSATKAPHFDCPVIASRDNFVLPERKAADGSLMTDKGGGAAFLFS